MRSPRSLLAAVLLGGLGLAAAACTEEATVPLNELPVEATTTVPAGASYDVSGHINNEGVGMGLDLARQQCLDDPSLDEGLVQMADEATGEVVAEFRQVCADVRP